MVQFGDVLVECERCCGSDAGNCGVDEPEFMVRVKVDLPLRTGMYSIPPFTVSSNRPSNQTLQVEIKVTSKIERWYHWYEQINSFCG